MAEEESGARGASSAAPQGQGGLPATAASPAASGIAAPVATPPAAPLPTQAERQVPTLAAPSIAAQPGPDLRPPWSWRRVLALSGWIAAATAAPMLAAVILHYARVPSGIREIVGLGSLTAMMVLLLAGVRSGRLAGWVLGPSIGFGLGILAQKAVYWPVHAGWSPRSVALLPLWGIGVGLAAGIASGSWRRAALLPFLVGALHLCGLCAWLFLGSLPGFKVNLLGNLRWLLESLAYAPAAIAVVLAMPRQR